jgi:peroxiredoxin
VPLLSDWAGEAMRGFGVETTLWELAVSRRSTFLVDGDGTVSAAWAYEAGELPDLDGIVAAARSL